MSYSAEAKQSLRNATCAVHIAAGQRAARELGAHVLASALLVGGLQAIVWARQVRAPGVGSRARESSVAERARAARRGDAGA